MFEHLFVSVNIHIKHHESLDKNDILMCKHTYIPLILEKINEDYYSVYSTNDCMSNLLNEW
jgi:hypothetical protein